METRCPRPDKLAFDTEEEAADRHKALLLTDLTMSVYQCRCRKWHAGRREENIEAHTLANVPRISTGLNPVPEPEPVPQRRAQPREVRRAGAVTTMTIDKRVWKTALQHADGDSSRIEVIDEHNVRIHNNGNWRKRRG